MKTKINDDLIKGSTSSLLFTHKIKENKDEEKGDELINQIIFKKYEVKKKCGKTSTMSIYEGYSKEENKRPIIIKVENKSQDKLYLENEAYNLFTFKGFGIPELIKLGKRNNDIILIQSKLGRSLNDLFNENNKKFSLNEICLIGIQCIERLKWIHSKKYIYRNIKPENFVIGIDDPHVIYLQNFYFCEKYKSDKTNQHAKYSYTKEFVGTERYGSISALRGMRQGRKDDLESLCYMLIYFFLGKLPWQGMRYKTNNNEALRYEKLLEEKKKFKIENYKDIIPKDFCTLFKYVKSLKFEQDPKYSIMIRLLQNIRSENQCFSNTNFFWIKKNIICLGANIKSKKDGFRERLFEKIDKKTPKFDTWSDFERKRIKNIDVNFENFGLGYIDDDDDYDDNDNDNGDNNSRKGNKNFNNFGFKNFGNEKSEFQAKLGCKLFYEEEIDNKKKIENNEDNEENESKDNNDLNISNSSINTKVFKLKGDIEAVIKKDLMNDSDMDNDTDDDTTKKTEKNEKKINQEKKENKGNKNKMNLNEIIREEPINEDEEEIEEKKNNKEKIGIREENNIIENNNNVIKSLYSNGTIKQDSTKASIQFNSKESDSKNNSKYNNNNNNNNNVPLIILSNNDNVNKKSKEEKKKKKKQW